MICSLCTCSELLRPEDCSGGSRWCWWDRRWWSRLGEETTAPIGILMQQLRLRQHDRGRLACCSTINNSTAKERGGEGERGKNKSWFWLNGHVLWRAWKKRHFHWRILWGGRGIGRSQPFVFTILFRFVWHKIGLLWLIIHISPANLNEDELGFLYGLLLD